MATIGVLLFKGGLAPASSKASCLLSQASYREGSRFGRPHTRRCKHKAVHTLMMHTQECLWPP